MAPDCHRIHSGWIGVPFFASVFHLPDVQPKKMTRAQGWAPRRYSTTRLSCVSRDGRNTSPSVFLIPRAFLGLWRFFRRTRSRLRMSCRCRMRSRLRPGCSFSVWCSLLARSGLRTSCSRLGLTRRTRLFRLRSFTFRGPVLVRASCSCLVRSSLILARASCGGLRLD